MRWARLIEMHQFRDVLIRLRAGDRDREIVRLGFMARCPRRLAPRFRRGGQKVQKVLEWRASQRFHGPRGEA